MTKLSCACFAAVKETGLLYSQLAAKLGKISTIDICTDYLRSGRGAEFIATAQVIRSGNKVCVCRISAFRSAKGCSELCKGLAASQSI